MSVMRTFVFERKDVPEFYHTREEEKWCQKFSLEI
jgi:hypothetical protein